MIRYLYVKLRMLPYRTPWYKAYITACVKKYRESEHWRIRATELGHDYADQALCPQELIVWKPKVLADKLLMLRIIFIPYSVSI